MPTPSMEGREEEPPPLARHVNITSNGTYDVLFARIPSSASLDLLPGLEIVQPHAVYHDGCTVVVSHGRAGGPLLA